MMEIRREESPGVPSIRHQIVPDPSTVIQSQHAGNSPAVQGMQSRHFPTCVEDFHRVQGRSWPQGIISRSASRASRISNRLSQASEFFYESFDFQGWGDSRAPTADLANGGLRRIESLESLYWASRPNLLNPAVTVRNEKSTVAKDTKQGRKRGIRIWAVMLALCVTQLLNAFEGTVTSTALPTIVADLGGGGEFIWASSGYFLTSTVFQPLFGQLANIFGRRWLILSAVAIFILGSGVCGAATSMGILILGRVIQGVGGGGINVLVNIVVCDMVPLLERGKFMAVIMAAISIGTAIGPILGGLIVQNTTWRWVFLLNLPVGGLSLILLFLFLKVGSGNTSSSSMWQKLARIDYGGNVIFIASVSVILAALAQGGNQWAWESYQTLASLVFGGFLLVVFMLYEQSNYCLEPTLPMRLFTNRTSAVAYILTFLHSLLTLLTLYFLPVYFQGVLISSPTISGVQTLPTVLILVPSAVVSGALLSKLGRFKPFHLLGFGLMTLGFAILTLLKASSPSAVWIIAQLLVAAGSGLALSTLLPAAQASLPDSDTAAATAAWAFLRSFGIVWGVAVPAAVFNARAGRLALGLIDNVPSGIADQLTGGQAYEHATAAWVGSLPETLKGAVITVFEDSLFVVWILAAAVAGLGIILVLLEKEVQLRSKLESIEFGLEYEEALGTG